MSNISRVRHAHRPIGAHGAPYILLLMVGLAHAAPDPEQLYATHCLSCHAPSRLGGIGSGIVAGIAGTPEEAGGGQRHLRRLAGHADARRQSTIAGGRNPGAGRVDLHAAKLPPKWDLADISASRSVNAEAVDLPAKPVFTADPMNITLVVEHGDHHITVLDGDKMELRHPLRYALRAARRAEVHAGRPLRVLGDARWLDHQNSTCGT